MSTSVSLDNSYRVVSRIGAGGGGTVYKAWHLRLRRHVVIKELVRDNSHSAQTQRTEIEALKNVKSPYLPQVYDFMGEGGRTFTVMEYVEGHNFEDMLTHCRGFSRAEIIKWYGQLASALHTLHRQGICHRDIKPANIMLTPDGDICLIDFNSALVKGNLARFISRSLGYASPEQYEFYERLRCEAPARPHAFSSKSPEIVTYGEAEQRKNKKTVQRLALNTQHCGLSTLDWVRSDIYSLGATMYHILTGKCPGSQAAEVIPIKKLGRFDAGIASIIEKSMNTAPSRRYGSAPELISAINKLDKRHYFRRKHHGHL